MKYEKHLLSVDQNESLICSISDVIWDFAETAYEEERSSKLLADTLEAHGF